MSSRKVIDSYAIIAFLENESGADKVGDLIKHARDSEKPLFMSVVNWGEVYYILHRAAGKQAADLAMQSIETLPIEVINIDKDLTRLAAEFKSTRKMSYADCFAAALAKAKKATVITGDKEFHEVENEVKIEWV